MKLINVEIFEFKSIKHTKIDFKRNQVCLVGKNETGKSSVIQAISYLNFIDRDLESNMINKGSTRYPKGMPIISGVFQLDKNSYSSLLKLLVKHLKNEAEIQALVKETDYLHIKRWGNGVSNISIILTDKQTYTLNLTDTINSKSEFIDEFNSSIYPSIEYYENEELLIEPATVDDLIGTDRKFDTFRKLLIIAGCDDLDILNSTDVGFLSTFMSGLEDRFNELIKKHYKQDDTIQISLGTFFGNKLSLIIKDSSKHSLTIHERSPGFQYYFSFLVNKIYSKLVNKHKNTILLLDEPGSNLHPKGSKDLLKSFEDITAENGQLLYTTHNPFLTIRNDIESLYFVTKSPKVGTEVGIKPFLNKYQILRKELGILLNDSFLIGDINLVVEGATEQLAFHRLFQQEEYEELQWINIYNADGATNVSQALNYLGNLGLAGIVVLDSDGEANLEKGKKSFKQRLEEPTWELVEINDAFSSKNERTFEDLFPKELYIEAFNKYCHSLKDKDVFSIDYQNYDPKQKNETPVITLLKEHFFSFIDKDKQKGKSISKQVVIGILLDDIDKFDEKSRNAALKNCNTLIDKIKSSDNKIRKHVNN